MPTVTYQITDTADDVSDAPAIGAGDDTNVLNGNLYGIAELFCGFRFLGVAVPKGATITSATLTLKKLSEQPYIGTKHGNIRGVAADNAPPWVTTPPSVAPKTTESVVVVNAATVAYDVKVIVQAIINRAGWSSGNALAFAGDGTGADGAIAWVDYSVSAADAAKLSITYETGGGTTARPTFQAFVIG